MTVSQQNEEPPSENSKKLEAIKSATWKTFFACLLTFCPYFFYLYWGKVVLDQPFSLTECFSEINEKGTYQFLAMSIVGSAFLSFKFRHPSVKASSGIHAFAWVILAICIVALVFGPPLLTLMKDGSTNGAKLKALFFGIFLVSLTYYWALSYVLKFHHPDIDHNGKPPTKRKAKRK